MLDEVSVESLLSSMYASDSIARIPKSKHIDPIQCAEMYRAQYAGKSVCVFIPGQLFDIYGNRHGRGGGWYDRFLSNVPREWLRIGVTSPEHLSQNVIPTHEWDEVMDMILVYESNTDTWVTHEVSEYFS